MFFNRQLLQAVPFSPSDTNVWQHLLRMGSGWQSCWGEYYKGGFSDGIQLLHLVQTFLDDFISLDRSQNGKISWLSHSSRSPHPPLLHYWLPQVFVRISFDQSFRPILPGWTLFLLFANLTSCWENSTHGHLTVTSKIWSCPKIFIEQLIATSHLSEISLWRTCWPGRQIRWHLRCLWKTISG